MASIQPPPQGIAQRVLRWQKQYGRTGLPWQGTRNPYYVWLSEIMLQQTQVSTVLNYFPRFVTRFPDVQSLASAHLDDVLALWSGMGYYSRARNLHRCATLVVQQFNGEFPASAELLQTLPGIGRSTAAAIAAFCFGERVAILDANVKRVLTRVLGFESDLAVLSNERVLWDKATALLPTRDLLESMPRHTQAMMDLGATVCTARKPACVRCPLQTVCVAHSQNRVLDYPVKTRKLKRSAESWWLVCAQHKNGDIFMLQRPVPGVWAGLYCFPVWSSRVLLWSQLSAVQRKKAEEHPALRHVLTHKDLYLHVVTIGWTEKKDPTSAGLWMSPAQAIKLGLPAPIHKMISKMIEVIEVF